MKYIKLTLSLLMIAGISYYGFSLFNAGAYDPVEWGYDSKKHFSIVLIGCVITYMVFSADPPTAK